MRDKIILRNRARERASQSQSQADWSEFRALRNRCTKMYREDKVEHFKTIFEETEKEKYVKKLYKTVKTQLGWTTNGPPTYLLIDGKVSSSFQLMANSQMNYYCNKL